MNEKAKILGIKLMQRSEDEYLAYRYKDEFRDTHMEVVSADFLIKDMFTDPEKEEEDLEKLKDLEEWFFMKRQEFVNSDMLKEFEEYQNYLTDSDLALTEDDLDDFMSDTEDYIEKYGFK